MELFDYEREHLQLLRSHLAECTVLLKSNGDFPLSEPGKIAAYGSGVRCTVKGGTGSGEVNSRYFVNVEQGLVNAGFTVTTGAWLDGYDDERKKARKAFIERIKAEAKAAHMMPVLYGMGKAMPEPEYDLPLDGEGDTAIYVLARNSGEGSDRDPVRGDILLSETEKRDILALNEKYEKFMLVLNVGGPVDLSELGEVKNILVLSQLGVEMGDALADILLGRQNPSGKLTTTWAKWEDYFPMEDFGDHNDTLYREGVYVGYRYFDSAGKKALYPFGFGGSYTSFELAAGEVSADGGKVTVCVSVTNTGAYAGKETVQVYVSAPAGKLDKPYQDLAGFAKTALLEPGEKGEVAVTFDLAELASYDEERSAYILEPGKYIVRVGNSSADTAIAAVLELSAEVLTVQARKCLGEPGFADWKPETAQAAQPDESVPVIALDAQAFATRAVEYDVKDEIDPAVKKLSKKQLAYLNIGAFGGSGSMSVIGQASTHVAGAAGESTFMLEKRGFPVMVMADGPAGLRLTPQFYRDKKGVAHGISSENLMESIFELLPPFAAWMAKKFTGSKKVPKGAKIENQYCSAIPIGTAIAQSWNVEFAEICGDIVGDEMERFGVHLWLAPALNIHRSIRCGRNFEYFSEDPFVSGKMAAAITLGVQKHPGCGVTIKHYAANNQETNRYGNSSHVSERAMREIYLKGFGICVRDAQPAAVMTSYNLLNDVHTAERRDLCDDILRREYGFEGIIMTDWVISMMANKADKHTPVQAHLVAAAGGDVFMPGCKGDFKDMLRGLRKKELTREQLQINATRMYRMAKRLTQK